MVILSLSLIPLPPTPMIFFSPFLWNVLLFDSKANELCPVGSGSTELYLALLTASL